MPVKLSPSNPKIDQSMNFDANILKVRKPLWIALSELFLDTELQDYTHTHIAKVMKESGYALDEIEDILMLEVFPVLISNLHSIAGEWAGFNEAWLCETLIAATPPNRFRRWLNRRSFWMINDDWQKIVEIYKLL